MKMRPSPSARAVLSASTLEELSAMDVPERIAMLRKLVASAPTSAQWIELSSLLRRAELDLAKVQSKEATR